MCTHSLDLFHFCLFPSEIFDTNQACTFSNFDLAIIMDQSGTISREEFSNITIFVESIVQELPIGTDTVRTTVIQFSNEANVAIPLAGSQNKVQLLVDIFGLDSTTGGVPRTDLAITLARNELTSEGGRTEVPKIAILFTDGRSNMPALTSRAAALARNDIEIFAVGIGDGIDQSVENELNDIATDNDTRHVFIAGSFDGSVLNSLVEDIREAVCGE